MDDIKTILPEEYNSAILGTKHDSEIAVYSLTKIVKLLIKNHHMDFIEAKEHFENDMKHYFDHSTESILLDDLHFVM
jgi:hypothetical protein